ncbi:hypothetical protein [Bacillus sonorensis]|nr:hypothetical protein [Bacillus sonorensis]TWK77938.1 hypothetical protein CHCC20335_2851 [Bacillus paralicheniformis]
MGVFVYSLQTPYAPSSTPEFRYNKKSLPAICMNRHIVDKLTQTKEVSPE